MVPLVTNIIPRKTEVVTVFGPVLEVGEPIEEPSEAQITDLMGRYEAALREMFEQYKAQYASGRSEEIRVEQ